MLEPVSVGLKFAFLAILYLFLLWVSRSALKDLRRGAFGGGPRAHEPARPTRPACTRRRASTSCPATPTSRRGWSSSPSRASRAACPTTSSEGATLGRGDVEIQLEDPFASSRHAQLIRQGAILVIEDLGSTNGTYLNDELLRGPRPLHAGDRVRIGDSTFTYDDR